MRVNSIQSNKLTFNSVTPIIATPKGKNKLEKALNISKEKYFLDDLTHLYKDSKTPGLLSNASKDGKRILFLITGDDYNKSLYMSNGWGSETGPTRHINRAVTYITEKSNYEINKLLKRLNSK